MCVTPKRGTFPRKVGGYVIPDALTEEGRQVVLSLDLRGTTDARLFAEIQQVRFAFGVAQGRRLYMAGPGGTCDLLDVASWLRERLRAALAEEQRRKGNR